jgi:hypothetical protein
MKRTFTLSLAAAATFAAASPAQAALTIIPDFSCTKTQVVPAADKCSGWYYGNLNGGGTVGGAVPADELAAINMLLDSPVTSLTVLAYLPKLDGATEFDFGKVLSGKTIIGLHKGVSGDWQTGQGKPGSGTAFYMWNNLSPQQKISVNLAGLSNATLYMTSAVPEPGTWLLMIAGVGLVGWQLRRRRQTVKVGYA